MYLIDTDICIQFMRGEKKVVNFLVRLDNINISIVTLAELFFGIYNSKNMGKHKKTLSNFLSNVSILNVNFAVAHNFGKIKSKLKNTGTLIGDFDILNAAFVLTYDFTLITKNISHYEKVRRIKIKKI